MPWNNQGGGGDDGGPWGNPGGGGRGGGSNGGSPWGQGGGGSPQDIDKVVLSLIHISEPTRPY